MGRPLDARFFGDPTANEGRVVLSSAWVLGDDGPVDDAYIIRQVGVNRYIALSPGTGNIGAVQLQPKDEPIEMEGQAHMIVTLYDPDTEDEEPAGEESVKSLWYSRVNTWEGNQYLWDRFGTLLEDARYVGAYAKLPLSTGEAAEEEEGPPAARMARREDVGTNQVSNQEMPDQIPDSDKAKVGEVGGVVTGDPSKTRGRVVGNVPGGMEASEDAPDATNVATGDAPPAGEAKPAKQSASEPDSPVEKHYRISGGTFSATEQESSGEKHYRLSGGSIASGGSGYQAGDKLTLKDGATLIVVSGEGNGAVTEVEVENAGDFTTKPRNPIRATGGSGSGFSYNAEFDEFTP